MKKLALIIATVAALGVVAGQAAADPPRVEEFSGSFTDTSCGFPIEGSFEGRDIVIEDSEDFVHVHTNVVVTLTANGKTLIDNDAFTFIAEEGTESYRGAVFNIQAPGVGKLLMDVGILIVDEEGNVIFQGGPHPAFYGDVEALCAYFADP